jgi:hypothetical protein
MSWLGNFVVHAIVFLLLKLRFKARVRTFIVFIGMASSVLIISKSELPNQVREGVNQKNSPIAFPRISRNNGMGSIIFAKHSSM